jgi:hypothetical protein
VVGRRICGVRSLGHSVSSQATASHDRDQLWEGGGGSALAGFERQLWSTERYHVTCSWRGNG